MASGVRTSCEIAAVKIFWPRTSSPTRSKAELTARVSVAISRGIPSVGSLASAETGSMFAARLAAALTGRKDEHRKDGEDDDPPGDEGDERRGLHETVSRSRYPTPRTVSRVVPVS